MSDFSYRRLDGENYDINKVKQIIKEENIKFIKLQFVDINGHVKNLSIQTFSGG